MSSDTKLDCKQLPKKLRMDAKEDFTHDYFEFLPIELIEYIVRNCLSDLRDYCALSRVNTKCKAVVDRLWKRYAQKRWARWSNLQPADVSWYYVCKECYQCENGLLSELNAISSAGYSLELLDEQLLRPFAKLPHRVDLVFTMLNDILDKPLCEADLILQHYSYYAYEYLVQQQLIKEWTSYFSLPEKDQDWETGAILIAEWMQATQIIDRTSITRQLDDIATAVGKYLLQSRNMTGSHDILADARGLSLPSSVVLQAINEILYNQLKFSGNGDDYYNPHNSYINKVLENRKGIPITLCCVYASVAKRLGLKLEPVNNPGHFLLKLYTDNKNDPEATYVDAFNRGRVIRQPASNSGYKLSLSKVYFRMLTNLLQIFAYMEPGRTWDTSTSRWSSIPLCAVISLQWELVSAAKLSQLPSVLEMSMQFSVRYRYFVFRIVEIAEALNLGMQDNIAAILGAADEWSKEQNDVIKEKPRATGMLWHVGLVMKHVKYHYRCVIYGRDEVCRLSKAWQRQMGVSNEVAQNPFYNVLVEDSSNRYAAQENLIPCPPDELGPIPHWEVSKYFQRWTGKLYLPGETLCKCYPEDAEYLQSQL